MFRHTKNQLQFCSWAGFVSGLVNIRMRERGNGFAGKDVREPPRDVIWKTQYAFRKDGRKGAAWLGVRREAQEARCAQAPLSRPPGAWKLTEVEEDLRILLTGARVPVSTRQRQTGFLLLHPCV